MVRHSKSSASFVDKRNMRLRRRVVALSLQFLHIVSDVCSVDLPLFLPRRWGRGITKLSPLVRRHFGILLSLTSCALLGYLLHLGSLPLDAPPQFVEDRGHPQVSGIPLLPSIGPESLLSCSNCPSTQGRSRSTPPSWRVTSFCTTLPRQR